MRAVGVGVDDERRSLPTGRLRVRVHPRRHQREAPAVTPPKPSRRRLTQAEWEAELQRAKGVQAADLARNLNIESLRTRTGRRRSWWQRGWKG